jgi:hypothetical protein
MSESDAAILLSCYYSCLKTSWNVGMQRQSPNFRAGQKNSFHLWNPRSSRHMLLEGLERVWLFVYSILGQGISPCASHPLKHAWQDMQSMRVPISRIRERHMVLQNFVWLENHERSIGQYKGGKHLNMPRDSCYRSMLDCLIFSDLNLT